MALTNKIIKGSDLMIFKDGVSIAHASSHNLSITPEISKINSKDAGLWGMSEVTGISWTLSAEHLYVKSAFEQMFNLAVTSGEKFEVYFGLKSGYKGSDSYNANATVNVTDDGNWTPDSTANLLHGYVLISSLSVSAAAGENATFSVEMQGAGALQLGTYSATSGQL